ncbi:MAG: hypothetical protein II752_06565 [Muribaculaceae bacterium]|nr:hypothetical protein [Muribaculaceae bacterium]
MRRNIIIVGYMQTAAIIIITISAIIVLFMMTANIFVAIITMMNRV